MKARQIKALRTRLGLTQAEFFDHLGMKAKSDHVKRQTIHRWEPGERNSGTAAKAFSGVGKEGATSPERRRLCLTPNTSPKKPWRS